MARITSSMSFFKNTLAEMGKLRDETWSDITLKVGFRSIYAHRLVLAAHCGYFKTLFLSNFSDSKSKEIDLSSVVDDADILDRIINYMYYGDIEYDEEDFWEVARLASYFEMEMLMAACDEKMHEQVTLHNSVQYYMFAHSHGYSNIDDMTNEVIEGRFHDYFVFQESTLELRPGDLKLMLDWGFFKNCKNASFLEFIGKWVAKGCSNQYIDVAKEIIEYLDQDIPSDLTIVAHKIPLKSLEECCSILESKLSDSDAKVDKDIRESFLKEFKSLVSQVQKAEEISIDDEEYVLFTLCERKKEQMLLNPIDEEKYRESHQSNWDSVYDVFAFRKRSNCWYHINTIESRPWWYDDKVLPFQRIERDAFVVSNTLVFVARNSKNAMKFDLEKNEWSNLTLKPKKVKSSSWFDDLLNDTDIKKRLSDIGNHFAVCNNELYVVIVKPDIDPPDYRYSDEPAQMNGCFFEICKVDSKDGYLTKVAKTSLLAIHFKVYLQDLERFECIRSSAHVQINESSGEMLVLVYIDNDLGSVFEEYISFVVNVKDGSTHFFPTETNDQLKYPFHDLYIVEKEDRFLIVHQRYEDTCEIVAEYNFFSKEIVFRKGISKPEPVFRDFFSIDEPREAQLFNGGTSALLYFSGYWKYTCEMKYIPFEEKRGEHEDETSNKTSKLENRITGESASDDQNNEMDESGEVEENDVRNSEDINTKSNVNEGKENDENLNEGSNVEEEKSEGRVNEERSPDGHTFVEKNEIKGIECIPPPFTTVRCVCEGKMKKEFLSTLKPVKMFLM